MARGTPCLYAISIFKKEITTNQITNIYFVYSCRHATCRGSPEHTDANDPPHPIAHLCYPIHSNLVNTAISTIINFCMRRCCSSQRNARRRRERQVLIVYYLAPYGSANHTETLIIMLLSPILVLSSCVNLLGYSLYFLPSYVFGTLVTETLFFYFLSGVQLSFVTYAAMFVVSLAITVAFCLLRGVHGLNGYLYAPFALQIWYVP